MGLRVTVGRAVGFTRLQGFEYVNAGFTISDSVYGSTDMERRKRRRKGVEEETGRRRW